MGRFDFGKVDDFEKHIELSIPNFLTLDNIFKHVTHEFAQPESTDQDTGWRVKMVELFKAKQIREARKLIIANCRTDEYEEMFRWLYRNVEFFGDTEDKQDEAVIVIRNGMVKHTQVADPEINLSATLIELHTL